MAQRYVDDDGQPRYGQRVSPEELEQIRREQGLGSSVQAAVPRSEGETEPAAPSSMRPGRSEESNPYSYAGQRPGGPGGSWAGASSLQPPAGGWSWQQDDARQPRRRWGMLVTGLIMLIVLPIALGVGAVLIAVDGSLSTGAMLTDSGEVYLDQGRAVGLYSSDTSVSTERCTVKAPSGAAIEVTAIGQDLPYASLTAPESGTYTVSCPSGTQGIVVGPALNTDRIVQAGTMLLVAGACGVAGLGLTIAGMVRLSRRR
nr:hypothetical protein [Actinomyces sp.]